MAPMQPTVVPWVTRWTHERPHDPITLEVLDTDPVSGRITYENPDRVFRDEHGWLWQYEPDRQYGGKPEFAQVSTPRQRRCMIEGLCQVCGETVPEDVINWLIFPELMFPGPATEPGSVLTMSPPTCNKCVPIALALCPRMRQGDMVIAEVSDVRLWGAFGEIAVPTPDEWKRLNNVSLAPGSEYSSYFLAKQIVVQFVEFNLRPVTETDRNRKATP